MQVRTSAEVVDLRLRVDAIIEMLLCIKAGGQLLSFRFILFSESLRKEYAWVPSSGLR